MKCDIFISYRRVDGRDVARTVQQALLAKGYDNIFFDYSSLRDGKFNEQIIDAINVCNDFILILSPESMKRCSNVDDWVARELDTAIKAGCKFIPLNINGSFQEFPADFPKSLSIIKYIEQTKLLTDEYFDASIDLLVQRLTSKPVRVAVKATTCSLQLTVDETSMVYLDDKQLFKLKGGAKRVIENLEIGKGYVIRLENLGRRGEEIVRTWTADGDDELVLGYAQEREEKKRREQEEKARIKAENEQLERDRMALQLILDGYDYWWYGGADGEIVVEKNGKLGFLDPYLKVETIACQWEQVSVFVDGVACVKQGKEYHLIDAKGQIILRDISECMFVPKDGYMITEKSAMMGLVDLQGKVILEHKYDDVLSTEAEYMYVLHKDSKWAVYNAQERCLASAWYDLIQLDSGWVRSSARTLVVEKYNHVDGGWPAVMRKGDKLGLLGATGKVILPCMADEVQNHGICSREDGAAIIAVNRKYGAVDKTTGQIIVPVMYDSMSLVENYGDVAALMVGIGDELVANDEFSRAAAKSGVVGVVDLQGREIVPLMYDYIDAHIKETCENVEVYYTAYSLGQKRWDSWNSQGERMTESLSGYGLLTKDDIVSHYEFLVERGFQRKKTYYNGRDKETCASLGSNVSKKEQPVIQCGDVAQLKAQSLAIQNSVNVEYNVDSKTVKINGLIKGFSGELVIPETIWHFGYNIAYRVTGLCGYGFRKCNGLTAISIPKGVTKLEDWTFYKCSALNRVTLPDALTTIGKGAFSECVLLGELVLPRGVVTIGDAAFYKCSTLKRVVLPEMLTTIGQQAFRGCTTLEEIVFPDSVTNIGDHIFYECKNLNKIFVPKGKIAKFRELLHLDVYSATKLTEY
ncbi:MAG: leucine-rich repeat protein [Bacteroidaceae bacterium]|nr:leucine-rich repeat protein [Bacteroidaceae bacterium]